MPVTSGQAESTKPSKTTTIATIMAGKLYLVAAYPPCMDPDKKKILQSLIPPGLFVALLWLIKGIEVTFNISLVHLGIYPQHWKGLIGIFTSPLIHENWSHLLSNSGPLLVLGGVIFYFYRSVSYSVFFLIYIMTGLWVWSMGREAYHIGASGVVYGLVAFVFTSGVLRRDSRLLALSMLVVFLYGSLVWGVFPELFPEKNISWESHLMGFLSGFVVAFYYRRKGPPPKEYKWEEEEDEEFPYWMTTDVPETLPDAPPALPPVEPPAEIREENKPIMSGQPRIIYEYKEGKKPDGV